MALILGIFVLYIPLSCTRSHAHVCVGSCMCCAQATPLSKLQLHDRPMRGHRSVGGDLSLNFPLLWPSYNWRRDRNNCVHWRSLYKGGGVIRVKGEVVGTQEFRALGPFITWNFAWCLSVAIPKLLLFTTPASYTISEW